MEVARGNGSVHSRTIHTMMMMMMMMMMLCRVSLCAVDRCVGLKPPARGFVMCSAGGSGSTDDVTTCRLVCPRGLTLPRPADRQPAAADQFQCRRDVGVWTPTGRVPSCVGRSSKSKVNASMHPRYRNSRSLVLVFWPSFRFSTSYH